MKESLFETKEQFKQFQQAWKNRINSDLKYHTSAWQYALYLALQGKDWRKAITPITNKTKLANGMEKYGTTKMVLRILHRIDMQALCATFDDTITPQMFVRLRETLPKLEGFDPEKDIVLLLEAA